MFENLAVAAQQAQVTQLKKRLSELMKACASANKAQAAEASEKFAAAVQLPIQQAIFADALYAQFADVQQRDELDDIVYPKSLIAPGDEEYFAAYSAPRIGAIPQRIVEQDYVRVTMDFKRASLDVPEDALARGDLAVLSLVYETLMDGVTMAMNDHVIQTLIAAAYGRIENSNPVIYEEAGSPTAATFTKGFLAGFQVKMRRLGSSYTSTKAFKLRSLYLSPEVRSSMVNLDNTKIDEVTRREIITAEDGKIMTLLGTKFYDLDELGTGKKYQKFLVDKLGGTLTSNRHLSIGFDDRRKSQVVMPVGMNPRVTEDPTLARHRMRGWWVDVKFGCGVLDNRVVLLGQN